VQKPSKEKRKISEKELEQELINLFSEQTQPSNEAESANKMARIQAITAYLLLRSGKRMERVSYALLIFTVVLAATMAGFALLLAYFLGLIGS
jgi:hypothetical protein